MSDADKRGPDADQSGIESSETHYKTSFTAIRKARRFALQGLYSWSLTDLPIHEIEAKTRSENAMHTVHLGYYHELLTQITQHVEQVDALIESAIDRPIAMITKIELAVLRIGVFELKYRLEIPFKVVIDEAIQLNEHFGSDQGYRFINAVMDKLASTLRALEVTELENQGVRQIKKTQPAKPARVKKSLERSSASAPKVDTPNTRKENSPQVRLARNRAIPNDLSSADRQDHSTASDQPKAEPLSANSIKPETDTQAAAKPEPAQKSATKSKTTAKPKDDKTTSTKSKVAKSKTAEPKTAKLKTVNPKTTGSKDAQLKDTKPKAAKKSATKPAAQSKTQAD